MSGNQSSTWHDPFRPIGRLRTVLFAAALWIGIEPRTHAQSTIDMQHLPRPAPTNVAIPEPIYWKQTLFQIPYQWGSAAEPGAAQVVWLLVSKDRGATWQKISEAKPHVKSFNYRAEAEGEYWFAVRTLDHQGRAWPAGEYGPELRVVVDTTMPRIEALQANFRSDGAVEIQWRGYDLNLDASSWKIEAQAEPLGEWMPVMVQEAVGSGLGAGSVDPNSQAGVAGAWSVGQTIWQPPAGRPPAAIRAAVFDRAGNSATFQTPIKPASTRAVSYQRLPATDASSPVATNFPPANLFAAPAASVPAFAPPAAPASTPQRGWISSSEATAVNAPNIGPADQPWPASTTARAPFRLSSDCAVTPHDDITAYGNPSRADVPIAMSCDNDANQVEPSTTARYAMNGQPHTAAISADSPDGSAGPAFEPVPPFRQASIARLPTPGNTVFPSADDPIADDVTKIDDNRPPRDAYADQVPPDAQPKLVGSRTFALEYELEQVGRWGVSNVELWGTRDGGQTWRSYARDDDQRSPLVVTVDEEGVYGFRIVVESAGSAAATPPSPGDMPELWVAVDLNRPTAELTAIQSGVGNLADHLILHWRADDENLESRPISLFYSSRPAGPWSAIATNLQNTGEYAWRVERHVPAHFYLRLEARDTAGNLAAFQTREPVEFATSPASGRLRSVEPTDPTATGGAASYR